MKHTDSEKINNHLIVLYVLFTCTHLVFRVGTLTSGVVHRIQTTHDFMFTFKKPSLYKFTKLLAKNQIAGYIGLSTLEHFLSLWGVQKILNNKRYVCVTHRFNFTVRILQSNCEFKFDKNDNTTLFRNVIKQLARYAKLRNKKLFFLLNFLCK